MPDVPYYKEDEWYIFLHGEECGPFETEEEADEAYEGGR